MLRERPLASSSWLCKSPNFRQEIRSSYYRNDSLKYDLNFSNDLQNDRLLLSLNRHRFFFILWAKYLKTSLIRNLNFKEMFYYFNNLVNLQIFFTNGNITNCVSLIFISLSLFLAPSNGQPKSKMQSHFQILLRGYMG